MTNDDTIPGVINAATFFPINSDGSLGAGTSVVTGGIGTLGGFFAAARVMVVPNGSDACVFAADGGSFDIAGIDAATQSVTGLYRGGPTDSGAANGIGLAANARYLYASYTSSSTIATFQMLPGCALSFVGDLLSVGLNGGVVDGMAVHGNLMVITYGDGSIESFDISAGEPVSNGDLQNSTGAANDHLPNSVIITPDGHYAIFGDASTVSTTEVSDISSGSLTPTVVYPLGNAWNSSSIQLSPDGTMLFVSNNSGGKVTAAFFNAATGQLTKGCTSPALRGFYKNYAFLGSLGLQSNTGTGGTIYVPEFGSNGTSYIGLLQLSVSGSTCTLTEMADPHVSDPHPTAALLSIAVYSAAP
ncbi:MAG TPA: hypothetical protein VMI94_27075 [Bryobacteraceae bacterium]|nr:hypothetical protein [Bryobacteraceae bacterium]